LLCAHVEPKSEYLT